MEKFLKDYGLKWIGDNGEQEGKFDSKAIN